MNAPSEPGSDSQERPVGDESSFDTKHTPFRSWALQRDLATVLGLEPVIAWGSSAGGFDDDPERSDRSGQAFLRAALEPESEYRRRVRTGTVLLALALWLNVLGLINPFGVQVLSEGASEVCVVMSAVALVLALLFFSRVPRRWFNHFEQALLTLTFVEQAIQVSGTGGARSPYLILTIGMVIYSAYFQPRDWVVFNAAIATGVVLAALANSAGGVDGYETVVATFTAAMVWALAISVFRSRDVSRRANRAVEFLALGDPLTGVANLRAYDRFASQLVALDEPFALIVFDMRGLRGVNTVFGYAVADEMLAALARILRGVSGERDQVARIGGDEFALLMPDAKAEDAELLLQRFDSARRAYNDQVRSRSPRISTHTGAATFPHDGSTPDALRDVADSRLRAQSERSVPAVWDIEETSGRNVQGLALDPPPDESRYREPAAYAAGYAVLMGTALALWLALPDGDVPRRAATFGLMLATFAVAAIVFSSRGVRHSAVTRTLAEVAALASIAPAMWITGGWRSPLQSAVILVVAFFAQFYRGSAAIWRIGFAIGAHALAYWTTDGASGVLFRATFVVEMTVAAVLLANGRSTQSAHETARHAATHDPLTGIPNAYAFRADLAKSVQPAREDAVADSPSPALLIVDIDEFHSVNLQGGHRAGDEAIAEVVKRLEHETGDGRSIYRVGGDEFAVLGTFEQPAEVVELADRCTRALKFDLANISEPITCSVGYAIHTSDTSAEQMVYSVEEAIAANKGARSKSLPGQSGIWL